MTLEPSVRSKLDRLYDESHELWVAFDATVRRKHFHPFVPGNWDVVEKTLLELRAPNLRFLEWGSGLGTITIMADLLGFDACGIEIDAGLVDQARLLAANFDSKARFAAGSFLPAGYTYRSETGDPRTGTIEHGRSGYLELGRPLDDFDLVFGYPWSGEEPLMRDLFHSFGGAGARLLIHDGKSCTIITR